MRHRYIPILAATIPPCAPNPGQHEPEAASRRAPKLPTGKTFDTFDFNAVPMVSKAQVMALAAGDSWLDQGANVMLFGPPGEERILRQRSGWLSFENGRRVLFIRTTDLVQRLQVARRDLELEAAINKLDKYQLLILDDIAYVTKDQAETSVLFELIAARYQCRPCLSRPTSRSVNGARLHRQNHDAGGYRPACAPRHDPGDER